MENTQTITQTESKSWYNKSYKILMLIPILIMVFSLVYLGIFFSKTGDFLIKDVSLSGGTTITLNRDITTNQETQLKSKFQDISIRKLEDLTTRETKATILESSLANEEFKKGVEEVLKIQLTAENSSIEFTGSSLSSGFYKQLLIALVISFVLMSFVIFILFRSFIPSIAVIFAAFSDIVMPLALIDFLGIKLSTAGIAAFLMLIGYSVDTDILLTTRALKKREPDLNQRIYGAFKTGSLMTITSLAAVLPAFFLITGLPDSFRQIFLVLSLGLFADLINTWLTNAGIIKWYCDKKGIR